MKWWRTKLDASDFDDTSWIAARCGWLIFIRPHEAPGQELYALSQFENVVFGTGEIALTEELWDFLYRHPAPQKAGGYYPDGSQKK